MEKLVVTIRDDICSKNGKDVNATALKEKIKLYGTIENYDVTMTAVKSEYQTVINDLTARYDAIKSLNLTTDEITLLNIYRKLKAENEAVHVAEKEELKKQLTDIKTENEGRIAKIAAILASASDAVK